MSNNEQMLNDFDRLFEEQVRGSKKIFEDTNNIFYSIRIREIRDWEEMIEAKSHELEKYGCIYVGDTNLIQWAKQKLHITNKLNTRDQIDIMYSIYCQLHYYLNDYLTSADYLGINEYLKRYGSVC